MKIIFNIFNTKLSFYKFVKILITIITSLTIFHFTIWNIFTKQLLDPPSNYLVGDLARLSYRISSICLRKVNDINLSKKHIEIQNWIGEEIPIVSFGDSFSNGGGYGKNAYYQDYIATYTHYNTLNIPPNNFGPIGLEVAIVLHNNGMLKKMKTKMIIVESIERYAVERYGTDINWSINLEENKFLTNYKNVKKEPYREYGITFINNTNYKFVKNKFISKFVKLPHKFSKVYIAELTKQLFSVKASNELLFFHHDISKIQNSTKKNIEKLNKNLNHLAKILKEDGVTLLFMPIVDKYNLYYPYIKNNTLPESHFFELLRPLKKEYKLIDTKNILRHLLKKCVKDVYYADDTHWNNIASQEVVKYIALNNNLFRYNDKDKDKDKDDKKNSK